MPVNFEGITTTRGRGYETPNLIRINEGLKPMPIDQRAAILGTIIEESGGNPLITNDSGAYQGLLQWSADRYRPKSSNNDIELNNQIQYIKNTIDNSTDGKSWTHGGKGSGYNSKDETYNTFHNDDVPFDKKFRALSFGYVRPKGKEDSYNNRLKVGKKVLNKLVVDEVLSNPSTPKKWTPRPWREPTRFPSKYDEGGYLNENSWDNLSMKDKAEMMRVAIANGITSLPEIRQAYNEFAKGGNLFYEGGDKAMSDINTPLVPTALNELNDVNVYPTNMVLQTYYPGISEYPYTGHSRIKAYSRMNTEPWDRGNVAIISKSGKDADYNLVTNNCSDATMEALERLSGTKYDKGLFTTPGDSRQYFIDNFEVRKNNPKKFHIGKGNTLGNTELVTSISLNDLFTLQDLMKKQDRINAKNKHSDGGFLDNNIFGKGGYIPSDSIKKRIANWEGSSMKTNRSFEAEASDFNRVIPAEIRSKLSPNQLDALYSYGYNVGMGKLKERVLPILTAYTQGKASKEDVQRSMWASKDNQLRGLTTRRNAERELFGGNFRTQFTGTGGLGTHIDLGQYLPSQESYNGIDTMINTMPMMQFPSTMDVDPTTLYKAPTIDNTLFANPKAKEEVPVYNPQQERRDNLMRFNTIMGLIGGDPPLAGLGDTSTPGLLSYINQIYS